jgi:hypothetical protein
MRYFLLLIAAIALSSCADSSQTGLDKDLDITVNIDITNSGGGNVTVSPGVDWETLNGDTDQESAAVAEATGKFQIPVSMPGGQANVGSTTEGASANQDNRVKNTTEAPVVKKSTIDIGELEVIEQDDVSLEPLAYSTRFHHTNKGAVVFCPGQEMNLDSCAVNGNDIPRHNATSGGDNGRETWMSTTYRPTTGDILCEKDGNKYLYESGNGIIYGDCGE